MKFPAILIACLVFAAKASCQLTIEPGGKLFIDSSASIVVAGDVDDSAQITGPGRVLMQGNIEQTLSLNGNSLSSLEINNAGNVLLGSGGATITGTLIFTTGKIRLADNNLVLAETVTINGVDSGRFIWTDGAGYLLRKLSKDVAGIIFPVGGTTGGYHPARLTTGGSSYSTASVGIRYGDYEDPARPPMIANLLKGYWNVKKDGITSGKVTVNATYNELSDITGNETLLHGYYYNGTDWSSDEETHNYTANTITVPVTSPEGHVYAMNKFITVGARVFLQGAYVDSTGLMNDSLRLYPSLIPASDPYRSLPYADRFKHVNNNISEIVGEDVLLNHAYSNDNIVDWVFIELRDTAAAGNKILQTRSALIQRDGDIVDIDGISPVTFNNVTKNSYTVAIRHRNHLGLCTDPVANPRIFTEKQSVAFTAYMVDMSIATDAALFGSVNAYATAPHPKNGHVNLLRAGNANVDGIVKYQGPGNDRAYILASLLNNPARTDTGYYAADINMNRVVRYTGAKNDKDFLLSTALQNQQLAIKKEELPK